MARANNGKRALYDDIQSWCLDPILDGFFPLTDEQTPPPIEDFGLFTLPINMELDSEFFGGGPPRDLSFWTMSTFQSDLQAELVAVLSSVPEDVSFTTNEGGYFLGSAVSSIRVFTADAIPEPSSWLIAGIAALSAAYMCRANSRSRTPTSDT